MKSFSDFMETMTIQDPKQLQNHVRDAWGGLNQAVFQISSILFYARQFPSLKTTPGLAELSQAVEQIEQSQKAGETAFRTFVTGRDQHGRDDTAQQVPRV